MQRDRKRMVDEAPAAREECGTPSSHAIAPYTSYLLWQVMRHMEEHITDALAPYGLRLSHLCVLRLLATRPRAQTTLGRTLQVNRMMIMRIVNDVESAGLVRRTPTPRNRRAYDVTLTPAGRSVLAQADAVVGLNELNLLAPLAADGQVQFRALLGRLIEAYDHMEPTGDGREDGAGECDG